MTVKQILLHFSLGQGEPRLKSNQISNTTRGEMMSGSSVGVFTRRGAFLCALLLAAGCLAGLLTWIKGTPDDLPGIALGMPRSCTLNGQPLFLPSS